MDIPRILVVVAIVWLLAYVFGLLDLSGIRAENYAAYVYRLVFPEEFEARRLWILLYGYPRDVEEMRQARWGYAALIPLAVVVVYVLARVVKF